VYKRTRDISSEARLFLSEKSSSQRMDKFIQGCLLQGTYSSLSFIYLSLSLSLFINSRQKAFELDTNSIKRAKTTVYTGF